MDLELNIFIPVERVGSIIESMQEQVGVLYGVPLFCSFPSLGTRLRKVQTNNIHKAIMRGCFCVAFETSKTVQVPEKAEDEEKITTYR